MCMFVLREIIIVHIVWNLCLICHVFHLGCKQSKIQKRMPHTVQCHQKLLKKFPGMKSCNPFVLSSHSLAIGVYCILWTQYSHTAKEAEKQKKGSYIHMQTNLNEITYCTNTHTYTQTLKSPLHGNAQEYPEIRQWETKRTA